MRPLDKGVCPQENGIDKVVTDYSNWRYDLISRIGYYCAYCNMPLSHSLQVEHVQPKNPPLGYIPGDPLAWDNMLLACGPCNNAKSNTPINFNDYYFPEENNTLLPFEIINHPHNKDAAIVATSTGLSQHQTDRAQRTIGLMELDNIDTRPNIVDIRWQKRKEVLHLADISYSWFILSSAHNRNSAAELIAYIAKSSGFFGIWFKVFSNEPLVIEKLIDNNIIPGTAQDCFDSTNNYRLNHRNVHTNPIDTI